MEVLMIKISTIFIFVFLAELILIFDSLDSNGKAHFFRAIWDKNIGKPPIVVRFYS